MKHPLVYFTLFVAVIAAACHKNKNTPQPVPTPPFDSTAYKDSLAHAQHVQDSIAHYQDSIIYRDSLLNNFINSVTGTRYYTGTRYFWYPGGDTTYSVMDTVTIVKGTNDTIIMSDSRHFWDINLNPIQNVPLVCTFDTAVKFMKGSFNYFNIRCDLYYYYIKDSVYIDYLQRFGMGGGNHIYLHTN